MNVWKGNLSCKSIKENLSTSQMAIGFKIRTEEVTMTLKHNTQ